MLGHGDLQLTEFVRRQGAGVLTDRAGDGSRGRLCSLLYFALSSLNFILRAVVTTEEF